MSEIRQAIRVSASVVSALAVVAGLGGLMLSSCGKDDDKKTTAATPAPSSSPSPSASSAALTYADVKSIIDTNCAKSGCHNTGGTSPVLATEAGVKAAAVKSLAEIKIAGSQGGMPVGTSTTAFDTTTDGKKLKEYLSGL
jgi:hypothetical protein